MNEGSWQAVRAGWTFCVFWVQQVILPWHSLQTCHATQRVVCFKNKSIPQISQCLQLRGFSKEVPVSPRSCFGAHPSSAALDLFSKAFPSLNNLWFQRAKAMSEKASWLDFRVGVRLAFHIPSQIQMKTSWRIALNAGWGGNLFNSGTEYPQSHQEDVPPWEAAFIGSAWLC